MIDRGVDVVAAPVPARRPRFGARLVSGAARLWARSNFNRRQTLAKIANRRLWRPATYPPVKMGSLALLRADAPSLSPPWPSISRSALSGVAGRTGWSMAADWLTEFGLSGCYLLPAAADRHRRQPDRLVEVDAAGACWRSTTGRACRSSCSSASAFPASWCTFLKHFIGRARPIHFAEQGAFAFAPLHRQRQLCQHALRPQLHGRIGRDDPGSAVSVDRDIVVIPLALAVGTSRIVLFSHYPSDVVAGLAFGSATTLLTAFVFMRLGYVFRPGPGGLPVRRRSFGVFW